MEPSIERLEECRHLLTTMSPEAIAGALLEQIAFETDEMGASELEQGIADLLCDFDVLTTHVASSPQLDSSALIEVMDFRDDVLILAVLVDENWRSPPPKNLDHQSIAVQVDLLGKFLEELDTEAICKLLQPYITAGDDAQPLVLPLGRALADALYPGEYLYQAIAEDGFLDTEPLQSSIEKRPDVILLATLPLDERFAELFWQPYIQRLLNVDLNRIRYHAKLYEIELNNGNWQTINHLLQSQLRNLRSQIETAYHNSLNPVQGESFEFRVVLTITQFRLDLDIALGSLFADWTRDHKICA